MLDPDFRIIHHGYAQSEAVLHAKKLRNLEAAVAVLRTHPDDPFYLFHAGLSHVTLNQSREAIPYLERAVRLAQGDGEAAVALNALGQAHIELGADDQAVLALVESTRRSPRQHWGWASLGDLYLRQHRHAEAALAYEKGLGVERTTLHTEFQQPRAIVTMKLGLALLVAGHTAAAATALERSFRLGLPPEMQKAALAAMGRHVALLERAHARGGRDSRG